MLLNQLKVMLRTPEILILIIKARLMLLKLSPEPLIIPELSLLTKITAISLLPLLMVLKAALPTSTIMLLLLSIMLKKAMVFLPKTVTLSTMLQSLWEIPPELLMIKPMLLSQLKAMLTITLKLLFLIKMKLMPSKLLPVTLLMMLPLPLTEIPALCLTLLMVLKAASALLRIIKQLPLTMLMNNMVFLQKTVL